MKKSASGPLRCCSEAVARPFGGRRKGARCKKSKNMQFYLNYQEGYVVTWQHMGADGYVRQYPLRKFLHQGDAMLFRDCDAPRLSDIQLRALEKNYNLNTLYRRISNRKFEKV